MQSDNNHEVVIAGGGIAGLATASLMARAGKTVRLFEQSRAIGGRAQTKEQDGFYLNIGPHALYRGGRGIQVLRALGIEPRGRVPSVSGAFAIRDGAKHTFPAGAVSLLTTSLFGLSAKLEAARLLASIGKIDGNSLMDISIREWLDRTVSHREVQDFVLAAFRVATYANAPELMSAGAAIEQLKKAQDKSVLYLDGGWQRLVDGLHETALGSGVIIETGAKVERVTRDATGAVEGVRLADGRAFRASIVVIASSPSVAVAMVEDGALTSLAQNAEEAIPVRAACLDLALGNLPRPRSTFALGIDRPLYFSVHSAAAQLAPEGCALIQAAMYLSPEHTGTPAEVEREIEGLVDLVQPGWRESVVYRRFLPDMTVANAIPLAGLGGTRGRPNPDVNDVPGLFVVGDWVGGEGMLADAALSSASHAAAAVKASRTAAFASSV
jgi:phytoene dehydrogenase-like protein